MLNLDRTVTLSWAPPALVDPVHIYLENSSGARQAFMEPDTDYIVHMPDVPMTVSDGVELNGGRNVVLIGGEINFEVDHGTTHGNRAFFIKGRSDQTEARTVFIEGVKIAGYLTEGVNVDGQGETGLTVIMQNIESPDPLIGSIDGNHSDFFQGYNGPQNILMDRVHYVPQYQGWMLQPLAYGDVPVGDMVLRRIYVEGTEDSGTIGYMVTGDGPEDRYTVTTDRVLVKYNPTKAWPSQVFLEDPSFWGDGIIPAPNGAVSFCTGAPGLNYVSPGYELSEGLIAHWELNGNATDSGPNALNGSISGGVIPAANRHGVDDAAMEFNGTSGQIVVPDSESFAVDASAISVSLWVQFNAGGIGVYQCLVGQVFDSFEVNKTNTNRIRMECRLTDGTQQKMESRGSAHLDEVDTWYHVTVTYRPYEASGNIWIDGQSGGVDYLVEPIPGALKNSTNSVVLGARDNSLWLNGRLDEVRIYNRALNPQDVSALYKEQA